MFKTIFTEIGLSDLTQKVFSVLLSAGSLTARQLADKVGIPRPSVYDHLNILIEKGLVAERQLEGKKFFYIDNIKNVEELLNDKIDFLKKEKAEFAQSLPSLLAKATFSEPQIKFYSGKEGMKQVMNHIMMNSHIETRLFWPMDEMMKLFGPEYLKELNEKRIRRNIYLRAIWPSNQKIDIKKYPYLQSGENNLRDLRLAPENLKWQMGYWTFDDKVAFLSSEKEGFGFVVQSQDFSNLIRIQFEELWKVSKVVHKKAK